MGSSLQNVSFILLKKDAIADSAESTLSLSESALSECHGICAAGSTIFQIRWKMMRILINHADKTINIPTACSTYFPSL